jgi:hypothetical protein
MFAHVVFVALSASASDVSCSVLDSKLRIASIKPTIGIRNGGIHQVYHSPENGFCVAFENPVITDQKEACLAKGLRPIASIMAVQNLSGTRLIVELIMESGSKVREDVLAVGDFTYEFSEFSVRCRIN